MKKIFSLVLALGMLSLASCVKEENVFSTEGKTPLEAPASYECEAGLSSASISWTPVLDAGMYYYEVRNDVQLIVKKGETTRPYVEIGGLRHSSTYKVYVKAIPSADVAKTYCASNYLEFEIQTAVKPERHWVWSQPATIYFSDAKDFKSSDAIFGLEEGTGRYVVEAWCGVEGFDLEFVLENQNAADANYGERVESNNGTGWAMFPIQGGSQFKELAGWELRLYHGLGGTANDYVSWDNAAYANGCFYKTNNEDGGSAYQWCFDPNGNWTYWQLTYGDGKGNAQTVEPEPWTPDPDDTADWDALGEATVGGESVFANISYTAADRTYYIEGWLGAEGYDLAFTRDAETGKWIVDLENSSSFAADCPKDGGHGFYGADGVYWLFEDESESGLEGSGSNGVMWISLVDPSGEEFTYSISWPAAMFAWTIEGSYYCAKDDATVPATLSYNANNDTYMLTMPPYNAQMTFTIGEGNVVVPITKGGVNVSDPSWSWIDFETEAGADYIWIYTPYCKADLAAGKITLCISHPDGYDQFTWKVVGVDDLVGTYAQETGAWIANPGWAYEYYYGDVTIDKIDDTTVSITGLINSEDALVGVVDVEQMTITIAAGSTFMNGEYEVRLSTMNDGVADEDPIVLNYTRSCTITTAVSWAAKRLEGGNPWWDQVQATLTKK